MNFLLLNPDVYEHTKAGKHPHLVLIIGHIFAPRCWGNIMVPEIQNDQNDVDLNFLSTQMLLNIAKQGNLQLWFLLLATFLPQMLRQC